MNIKKLHLKTFFTLLCGVSLMIPALSHAQLDRNRDASPKTDGGTKSNYRLSVRDRIAISVFDEPELAMAQGIDAKGEIRVPLLGVFRVEGMTIREVEKKLEEQYVEQKILRAPIVTIDVLAYSPKEVSIFGAVMRPGQIPFPPEIEKLDIIEMISKVGGFTPLAKASDVRVTRTLPNGSQIVLRVDVEAMIKGRNKNRETDQTYIYPGDLIFVDEHFL